MWEIVEIAVNVGAGGILGNDSQNHVDQMIRLQVFHIPWHRLGEMCMPISIMVLMFMYMARIMLFMIVIYTPNTMMWKS